MVDRVACVVLAAALVVGGVSAPFAHLHAAGLAHDQRAHAPSRAGDRPQHAHGHAQPIHGHMGSPSKQGPGHDPGAVEPHQHVRVIVTAKVPQSGRHITLAVLVADAHLASRLADGAVSGASRPPPDPPPLALGPGPRAPPVV